MTDLLAQVTPLTKGILWFAANEIGVQQRFYKDIDYLLNGLLTATKNSSPDFKSLVLIGENFGNNAHTRHRKRCGKRCGKRWEPHKIIRN